jgi:hypothetical protein
MLVSYPVTPDTQLLLVIISLLQEGGVRTDLRESGWGGGVERIQLAQDRDRWRTGVNTVMNLPVWCHGVS